MVKRLNDFLSLLDLCRYSRGRESLQLPKTPGGCGQIHSSEFLTVYEDRWIFCPQWGAGNFWTILYACIFWLEKHTCHVPPWPIWPLGGLWTIQPPSNFTLFNVGCESHRKKYWIEMNEEYCSNSSWDTTFLTTIWGQTPRKKSSMQCWTGASDTMTSTNSHH